ncbi:hypothetical protein AVEN_67892-1 [Araneus ventricosus]|uniref:Uncharacterized protein n=1 Tax=Araneus ventricosus TaxID=182803 RepID=A0A4Y2KRW4_ARAVE|nr:hypothetical protein AVEN_67892-1 [Araneus ventricosus]
MPLKSQIQTRGSGLPETFSHRNNTGGGKIQLAPETMRYSLRWGKLSVFPKVEPAGVFSPKLFRILPQKGAISPSPAWLKKFEPTVTQNPMTIRRLFIIVIEKYLGKESNSKRCVPIFRSYRLKDKLT